MMKKLFQTRCPILWEVFVVCALTLLESCNGESYSSPEGYDLNKPQLMQLGKVLNEISGIAYNTENNTLLAISDSKEKVYEINVERRKLKDFTERVVGTRSDLEDLAKVDSVLYLLGSKGAIYKVPLVKHVDTSVVQSFSFSSDKRNEFETIYYDPSVNGLVIICKSCAFDKSE